MKGIFFEFVLIISNVSAFIESEFIGCVVLCDIVEFSFWLIASPKSQTVFICGKTDEITIESIIIPLIMNAAPNNKSVLLPIITLCVKTNI